MEQSIEELRERLDDVERMIAIQASFALVPPTLELTARQAGTINNMLQAVAAQRVTQQAYMTSLEATMFDDIVAMRVYRCCIASLGSWSPASMLRCEIVSCSALLRRRKGLKSWLMLLLSPPMPTTTEESNSVECSRKTTGCAANRKKKRRRGFWFAFHLRPCVPVPRM